MSAAQRVAVVTGGAGGIGRAIAARLQRDGMRVALWDLDARAAREAADALSADENNAVLCSRAAVKPMLDAGFGRIVNLASIAGKEGNPSMSAYSAAKAGVIAFTKSMSKELALTPVRVNCIAPAVIDTPLLQQMTPDALAASLAKIPMQRAGTADEVASLAAWLASGECSFSTGATFDLSGGRATY